MKQELAKKPTVDGSAGIFRFIAILISATLTTALFNFLGTPLLRVFRNVFGPWKYWISGLTITAILISIITQWPEQIVSGCMLLGLWLNIGVYQEFEERGHGNFWAAALAVAVGSVVALLGPYWGSEALGLNLIGNFKAGLEQLTRELSNGRNLSEYGISPDMILSQIPGWVIVMQVMALAFALMLDRRFAALLGLRFEKIASQMRLLQFRVPDVLIWVTMISFLFGFVRYGPPIVSIVALNVFIVMMSLYFFQGLAVIETSFLVFRIGALIRLLIYLIVIGQLFFLLSAVGLIDYWVDFRQRLKRRKMSEKSQNNGENV